MQKKKGISLIVLVITIIVMIILASAIIITLSNTGVINKANEAVDSSNDATVKQIASLAWAEAYADGKTTEVELKAEVVKALVDNNLDPEDYYLNVTATGVTIKKGWVKEGFTVVKGSKRLEIGDLVNYDAGVSTYTAGWKVLGADDNGNLLIMSAGNAGTKELGSWDDLGKSQNDWLNGPSLLDKECEPYGKGKGVVGKARSITVEDVNAVTGYDPKIASNGTPYEKGQLSQYGNTVTYKYNETTKPAYESVVKSGTLQDAHTNGFHYYDGEEIVHITDLTTGTSGNVFATLTSDYYAPDLTTISKETNAKAYEMIFSNDDTYYWLASPYVYTSTYSPTFGMSIIENGSVSRGFYLWNSTGASGSSEYGVRAIVTLSSDINFTGSSTTGWSY